MKLRDLREKIKNLLTERGIERPLYTADLIIESEIGLDRAFYAIHGEREIPGAAVAKISEKSAERARRVPLSYILGEAEFYGRLFKVGPGVLIPRPETELLVESVLELVPRAKLFADWCTGSCCIAVSLLLENDCYASALAVDASPDALKWAKRNVVLHGLEDRVKLVCSSDPDQLKFDNGIFDFITANPPYISTKDIDSLMDDVRKYEPRQALDGGPSGDEVAAMLLRKLARTVRDCGIIAFECAGRRQMDRLIMSAPKCLEPLREINDYAGTPRHVIWRKSYK